MKVPGFNPVTYLQQHGAEALAKRVRAESPEDREVIKFQGWSKGSRLKGMPRAEMEEMIVGGARARLGAGMRLALVGEHGAKRGMTLMEPLLAVGWTAAGFVSARSLNAMDWRPLGPRVPPSAIAAVAAALAGAFLRKAAVRKAGEHFPSEEEVHILRAASAWAIGLGLGLSVGTVTSAKGGILGRSRS